TRPTSESLRPRRDERSPRAEELTASGMVQATVTLSVVQLEALIEPLVHRAVERALAERAGDLAGPATHVPAAVAARLLGMPPNTVANMLSDGRLTRYGAPRCPLVALEEIQAITHPRGHEAAVPAAAHPRRGRQPPRAATFSARARAE